jgi:hypothetical protein
MERRNARREVSASGKMLSSGQSLDDENEMLAVEAARATRHEAGCMIDTNNSARHWTTPAFAAGASSRLHQQSKFSFLLANKCRA